VEFDQLRTLLAVLEHGSFTRAAEALGLSQSTVSFHIKGLEASVDARVLDRGRDGVQATPQGRILRRYAERLVGLRAEALACLESESRGEIGHVVVAASTVAAEVLLPPVLAQLRQSHPGVGATVGVSDSGTAVARLLAGDCDIALVGSPPQDRRLLSRPFATDEVVFVGPSPNPHLADSGDAELSSLSRIPLVLRQEGSGTRAAVAELLARFAEPASAARVTVGSSEAAKRCVLAGLGMAFISRHAVAQELADGRLTLCALPGLPVRRSFFVAQLRNATPSSAGAALIDLLVDGD